MNSEGKVTASLESLMERLSHGIKMDFEVNRMEPLFENEELTPNLPDATKATMSGKRISPLMRETAIWHRRRFHHYKGGACQRRRSPAVPFLQQ